MKTGWLLWIPMCVLAMPATQARAATADVEIYRCAVDGKTVTQDKPCKQGREISRQTRQRPRDPPKPAILATTPVSGTPAHVTYVVNTASSNPRPLYQCTTSDGQSYMSENAEGEARWVAPYGVAYGIGGVPHRPVIAAGGAYVRYGDRNTRVQIGTYYPPAPVVGAPVGMAGGYWVRDRCSPLPQARTCEVLDARLSALQKKNVALQASDREALETEAAGITARIRADCR